MVIDKNLEIFVKNLVLAITGLELSQIASLEERTKIIMDCMDIYQSYLIEYVRNKYGVTDANRLLANRRLENQNIYTRFPDLEAKVQDAFTSFIDTLKTTNQNHYGIIF